MRDPAADVGCANWRALRLATPAQPNYLYPVKFSNLLFTVLPRVAAILLFVALATGCRREEIQVYRIEKDDSSKAAVADPHAGHADAADPHAALGGAGGVAAMPKLNFKLPAGWTEQPPSSMRAASFAVGGADGQAADVAVIPLPGMAGRDLEMVNMWRTMVHLEKIDAAEMDRLATKVQVGSAEGKLFDMAASAPAEGEKFALRLLVAMLEREGAAWFFKMTGPDALVKAQRDAFVQFLKSAEFTAGGMAATAPGAMPVAAAAPAAASEGKPTWTVPAGWQEVAAGQFLVAKFAIAGDGGAQAAVNISMSGGEGGGLISNVNRWRKQLGLNDLSADEIIKAVTSVETSAGKAMFVEMSGTDAKSGQPARVVGALVPQAGQTWFYKLMGDPKVVESQKAAFTTFVQSAKY